MSVKLPPRSIEWIGGLDGCARLIDQTRLPGELTYLDCHDAETICDAIQRLAVRGAPAIGIAGAMGAVLGARDYPGTDRAGFLKHLNEVCDYLASSRPTAVNLSWALNRMRQQAERDAVIARQKEIKERGFLAVMWPQLLVSLGFLALWLFLIKAYLAV